MITLKQLRAINSRLQSKAVQHFHRNFSLDVLQNPKFAFEYMLRKDLNLSVYLSVNQKKCRPKKFPGKHALKKHRFY